MKVLYSASGEYNIEWFASIEPSLHSWDCAELSFNVLQLIVLSGKRHSVLKVDLPCYTKLCFKMKASNQRKVEPGEVIWHLGTMLMKTLETQNVSF